MVRTQIQLTVAQAREVRRRARRDGLSMAETIRRFVEQGLAAEQVNRAALYARAAEVVGRFRDRKGAKNLARRHDQYLAEAFD